MMVELCCLVALFLTQKISRQGAESGRPPSQVLHLSQNVAADMLLEHRRKPNSVREHRGRRHFLHLSAGFQGACCLFETHAAALHRRPLEVQMLLTIERVSKELIV